jgi:AcrR family transcriptional regulator
MNPVQSGRPYKSVARAEARERTREALLDAAEATFFADRWERASLSEVADSAGVTKQTLLRHFGSKQGLLEAAWWRGIERVREQRWLAPTHDIPAAVDNLLDHYEVMGARAMSIAAGSGGGEAVAEVGRAARELHYEWVEHAFGSWLERYGGKPRVRVRAALIALCDVHTWWLMSHDLALGRAEVRATLIQAISSLLEEET